MARWTSAAVMTSLAISCRTSTAMITKRTAMSWRMIIPS
jgi:hypothetical protein